MKYALVLAVILCLGSCAPGSEQAPPDSVLDPRNK